jgi:UPF0755 protein
MRLSRGSRWFLAFGLLGLAGLAAALWWADANLFAPEIAAGEPVEYEVERGQSVRGVGEELAGLGVLRNPVRFRLAADNAGLAATLQPGQFELETGMEVEEVIAVLEQGPVAPPVVRFTVQEGLTVEQTLVRLDEQFEAFSAQDFRAVLSERREAGEEAPELLELPGWVPEPGDVDPDFEAYEGLLFPETYEVADTAAPLEVLQRMVDQLDREVTQIPDEVRGGLAPEDIYEKLIVASLIERETRVDQERGTVAGVIANRREEGMRLQIDATVVYVVDGGATDIVQQEDLEVDSPYNTYLVDSLPPTPISGVGSAALQAAFDPEDVPFRYYVLDPACDGSHRFAETLDEHNSNVAAFRDAGRCQDEGLPT